MAILKRDDDNKCIGDFTKLWTSLTDDSQS